ncbi:MAG: hypothetical protein A2Y10_12235 [Planctomycetes bacterium GWF2_41_51]|nr:MAG: hypothetical protein A2Y10_12235 [Planctomycetes bacterium GWF2_41_51]HBG28714.1 hypothetical protein [Phycisphaerales bacterium]
MTQIAPPDFVFQVSASLQPRFAYGFSLLQQNPKEPGIFPLRGSALRLRRFAPTQRKKIRILIVVLDELLLFLVEPKTSWIIMKVSKDLRIRFSAETMG